MLRLNILLRNPLCALQRRLTCQVSSFTTVLLHTNKTFILWMLTFIEVSVMYSSVKHFQLML